MQRLFATFPAQGLQRRWTFGQIALCFQAAPVHLRRGKFSTLEAPGTRTVTLDGQQFVSGDRSRHLYNVHFCRDCGQEYIPVWDQDGAEGRTFAVRNIEEREHEDDAVKAGRMPDASGIWDEGNLENYPET